MKYVGMYCYVPFSWISSNSFVKSLNSSSILFCFQIERDKLVKEQQAHEEVTQQKEELERRMIEYQEEASRAKEALVNTYI